MLLRRRNNLLRELSRDSAPGPERTRGERAASKTLSFFAQTPPTTSARDPERRRSGRRFTHH